MERGVSENNVDGLRNTLRCKENGKKKWCAPYKHSIGEKYVVYDD